MTNHPIAPRHAERCAILADVSGSMLASTGSKSRIDVLRDVFAQIRAEFSGFRLIAFSSVPIELLPYAPIPDPSGGTALHLALRMILPHEPERIAVLCDGTPDDASAALEAAKALHCHIASYFCGDDDDHAAIAFMRALAWCSADGIGSTTVVDMKKPARLKAGLQLLLSGPAIA